MFLVSDALEVIPTFMSRWDDDAESFVRSVVEDLAKTVPHLGERFQMLLDMPDEEYAAVFLSPPAAPAARAA